MKAIINDNVLVVKTEVTVASMGASKRIAREKTQDKPAYTISMSEGDAELSKFGMCCNTVIGGKAAATIILPIDVADAKKYVADTYGEALLAAQVTDEIAAAADNKAAAIAAILA